MTVSGSSEVFSKKENGKGKGMKHTASDASPTKENFFKPISKHMIVVEEEEGKESKHMKLDRTCLDDDEGSWWSDNYEDSERIRSARIH